MSNIYKKDFAPSGKWSNRKRRPFKRIVSLIIFVLIAYSTLTYIPKHEDVPTEADYNKTTSENKNEENFNEGPPPEVLSDKRNLVEDYFSRQTDGELGKLLTEVLGSQKPFGAFYLMVDGSSGKILAWGQQENFIPMSPPTYLPSSEFPAASLLKIVTAAAALESRRYSNYTKIPALGKSFTLYRKQLKIPKNYKGRSVSLEKAFASSINPSMAIVGISLGSKTLVKIAGMLGFNAELSAKVPKKSIYKVSDDIISVAEAASGFTNDITISPLHVAAIVRSVLKGAPPEIPWSDVLGPEYAPSAPISISKHQFTENTYYGLRRMFEATVRYGSAKTSFNNPRVLYPYNKKRLRIGGKTGTKDGKGVRYEWFAGYAQDRKDAKKSLILVCLHINELKGSRAHHPAQAAALLINHWAKRYLD